MTGQCATCRLQSGSQSRVCGSKLSLRLAWVVGGARLQLFQPQLQLLDLPIQFLRLTPKLHAPQLGDQQLQMLDLALVGEQLLMLRKDQRLQSSLIQQVQVGKDGVRSNHIRSMPSTLLCEYSAAHKNCANRTGELRSPTAAPPCAPDAANRCLPAASITALASVKPCRPSLVAR